MNEVVIMGTWGTLRDQARPLEASQRARDEQRPRGEAEPKGARVERAPRREVSNAREQRVSDGEVAESIQDVHERRRLPAERGRGERGRKRAPQHTRDEVGDELCEEGAGEEVRGEVKPEHGPSTR